MNPLLLSAFNDDQREQAASIGEYVDLSLVEKVAELFRVLPDPLLSTADIKDLLGTPELDAVVTVTEQLREQGVLESSTGTQRPFDSANTELWRLADVGFDRLILTALEARLSDGSSRYQLTCDGRLIRCIAEVDRLDAEHATGQQRSEIRKHVEDIASGIRAGTQIPNSILLTLIDEKTDLSEDSDETDTPESWTRIQPTTDWFDAPGPDGESVQSLRLVEIDFPFRRAAFDDEKTALLVDGQQRTAALSLVSIDTHPSVDLSVNVVVAGKDAAKTIFGVANNAKPIPSDFKMSLLASMDEAPGFLENERARAVATRILALGDASSPFYHLVKYPGYKAPAPTPVVYNSLFQVVRAFERTTLPGADSADGLANLVGRSFSIVQATWPDEWGRRPQESRLMHGAGLRAMAEMLAWWLQIEVGTAADEVSEDVWKSLDGFLAEMANRVAWSSDAAATASKVAADFFVKYVADRQNTNQDVTKLFGNLQGVAKAIAKASKG